jgi:hypothetical protein
MLIVGVGFHNVTVLLALALESAAAVPLMVTLPAAGKLAGAVYAPAELITPVAEFPPETPLTDQATD